VLFRRMTMSACERIYSATDVFLSRFVVSEHLQAMRPRYGFVFVHSLNKSEGIMRRKYLKYLIITKVAVRFSVKCTWGEH
jgi:hypothetical protein